MTAEESLMLVFEEPYPSEARWALHYAPPFLSADTSEFLPRGSADDPTPRSTFVFSAVRKGRGEVEFVRLPLRPGLDPIARGAVTVAVL